MESFLLNFKKLWSKIEIPIIVLVIIIGFLLSAIGPLGFDTTRINANVLSKFYTTNFNGYELFGFLIVMTKNLVIWTSIHLFKNNFIFSAIILIIIPRVISLYWSNRQTNVTAIQGLLKPEYLKLKKYYVKAPEDKEVQQMYQQDSMKLSKKFGISTTENIAGMLLSMIPVMLVSFAISPLVNELRLHVTGLNTFGIDITKPFFPVIILMVVLMGLQSYIPLRNAVGPSAEQTKQIVIIMPVMFAFIFMNQPMIIPLVWLVTYLISLIQVFYYHRLKKFSRKDILDRH